MGTVTIGMLGWSPSAALAEQLTRAGFTLTPLTHTQLLQGAPIAIFVAPLATPKRREVLTALSSRKPRPAIVLLAASQPDESSLRELSALPLQLLEVAASDNQLLLAFRDAAARHQRMQELGSAREETAFEGLVATSPQMQSIFDTIEKVAAFSTTVLIRGESGTGKELVARAIHARSPRAKKPFIALNCGAIPENLLESELFGHRKGSFTDASKDKRGLFEEANRGTILLDEVGELPIHLQVKLLRVLQEQAIQPIGAAEPVAIDVRILAATLRDLEADVEEGRFRDDLYYRLNVVPITVPALRERPSDIQALIQHFLVKHRSKLGLNVYSVTDEVAALLLSYPWPGNIRELENTLERAMILAKGEVIEVDNLPDKIKYSSGPNTTQSLLSDTDLESLSIKTHTRELEEALIQKALAKTGGNRTHAAKLLDISHRTLLYKLKEYALGE